MTYRSIPDDERDDSTPAMFGPGGNAEDASESGHIEYRSTNSCVFRSNLFGEVVRIVSYNRGLLTGIPRPTHPSTMYSPQP